MKKVLVLAPHHDDEVLGVGGTMARWAAEGAVVEVAVITKGAPPLFAPEGAAQVRRELAEAHAKLGVSRCRFLDLPAAQLDSVPHHVLNGALADTLREVEPDVLYIPFPGDIHLDHQIVSLSALVAARPTGSRYPRAIYAYETLSETNWNAAYLSVPFTPNHFVDVTDHLDAKMAALRCFASQMRPFPSERSVEAVQALAMLRGATVGVRAAEAFVTIRVVT
jgi:LmbE family N-acetylglucosaminyl deacetylase